MLLGTRTISSETDINKNDVIPGDHAIKRFIERSKKNRQPLPESEEKTVRMLFKFFLASSHKNAVDPVQKVKVLMDHGETFFFRNGRWQFRVAASSRYPDKLEIKTVIWLTADQVRRCLPR